MSNLIDFLCANPVDNLTQMVKVSDRVPYEFKIKAMTQAEFNSIQTQCSKRDKKGNVTGVDNGKLMQYIVINQTLEPSFNSADLISKMGCATPLDLVNKLLLSGEITELAVQINKLSGFDVGLDELVEEAKN